jgi:hypothetical protein
VWLAPTWEGMVALQGLLEPEAGQTLLAALEPLARPANAQDERSGGQRRADALCELARRALEGDQLPQTGGVRPQLNVIVDLDSLLGGPGAVGGEAGWAGPLAPEACRRLACDGALTRMVVTRHHPNFGPALTTSTDPTPVLAPMSDRSPVAGARQRDFRGGCGRPWTCCPRSWVAAPANPWMSAGAAGSSPRPSAAPWRSATVAVCFPTATGRWPGVRAITYRTGWMAAQRIWPTWPCCAGLIIGRSMRGLAAGPRTEWPLHRHPTASTPPTTSRRRLSWPHGAGIAAPPLRSPPTVPGERMAAKHPWPPCQAGAWRPSTPPPCQATTWALGAGRQPQNRLWAPNRAAGSQGTRGPRYIRTVR